MVARNPRKGRGEIDLLVRFDRQLAAVEVKTRLGEAGMDPAEAFTPEKAAQVRRLAANLRPPAYRVDLVAVTVGREGVAVRWVPGA